MTIISRTISAGLIAGRSAPLRYSAIRNSGNFYTQNNVENYGDSLKHQLKSANKTSSLWKKIFYFAAVPSILAAMWYVLLFFYAYI